MKFLIFGGPGIGDTIFEIALAKSIKKYYPKAEVDLLISEALGTVKIIDELLECQDYVNHRYCYSKKKIAKCLQVILRLRMNKYDYAFSCTSEFKANKNPSIICKLINCKSIIKEIEKKTGKIDFPVSVREDIHIVEQYQTLLRVLQPQAILDVLVLNESQVRNLISVKNQQKPTITICLGSNITFYYREGKKIPKQIKEWDVERWCELTSLLVEEGYHVILIGGKKEKETFTQSRIGRELNAEIGYLGNTSIKESLSIIAQSELVIGADTGMMHCAAALNKTTITLFGGTDSMIWRPFSHKSYVINGDTPCAPCYGKDYAIDCAKRKCMDSITVSNVLDMVHKIRS